jgi:hypothetical protein
MSKLAYTVVMPGLFDTRQRVDKSLAPALSAWLKKSAEDTVSASYYDLLLKLFGYVDRAKPAYLAKLRAISDGLDANAQWLCADPLHLGVDVAHVYSLGNAYLELSIEEVEGYVESINSFLPADIQLVAPHPLRWYLRLPEPWDITCFYPDDILAKTLLDKMPQGKDRIKAINLFNEIQMLLHDHSLNMQRRSENKPTLDGLWLWGSGESLESAKIDTWDSVKSDDPIVNQLAEINNIMLTDNLDHANGRTLVIDSQYQYIDASEQPFCSFPDYLLAHLKTLYPGNGFSYIKKGLVRRLWNK